MKLEISLEADFLKVVTTGEFSLDEAKGTFLEMLEAVSRHNVRKVLFDGRGLEGAPEIMERFYYGEFAARSVAEFAARKMLSRSTRFGYVLKEPVRDPGKFGENVAVNRGMCVKSFENVQDAIVWLQLLPAQMPNAGGGNPA